jgi:hypothetical protein
MQFEIMVPRTKNIEWLRIVVKEEGKHLTLGCLRMEHTISDIIGVLSKRIGRHLDDCTLFFFLKSSSQKACKVRFLFNFRDA